MLFILFIKCYILLFSSEANIVSWGQHILFDRSSCYLVELWCFSLNSRDIISIYWWSNFELCLPLIELSSIPKLLSTLFHTNSVVSGRAFGTWLGLSWCLYCDLLMLLALALSWSWPFSMLAYSVLGWHLCSLLWILNRGRVALIWCFWPRIDVRVLLEVYRNACDFILTVIINY